jgi:hypothetical protein
VALPKQPARHASNRSTTGKPREHRNVWPSRVRFVRDPVDADRQRLMGVLQRRVDAESQACEVGERQTNSARQAKAQS